MKTKQILVILSLVSIAVFLGALFFRAGNTPGLARPDEKQRGVSWVAGREPVTKKHFEPLLKNHVDWIVQTPFAWQSHERSPNLVLLTEGVLWGETDGGLETTTRIAQRLGIKTLLKPHVWLTDASDGKSWMDIEMESEDNWQRWFDNYASFILHYARLADRLGIEGLCVGTELQITTKLRENDWRKLIAEIRQVYHGRLTYAANWYKEFEEVRLWDALDFIGIQAYFPLTDKRNASVVELKAGWKPHVEAITRIQKQFGKPVLFTEIGYRSASDCAIKPWEWPERDSSLPEAADLQAQADCYEAFFQTFWDKKWFAGAYIWKWYPSGRRAANTQNSDFTPQHKPAEAVLATWYGKN